MSRVNRNKSCLTCEPPTSHVGIQVGVANAEKAVEIQLDKLFMVLPDPSRGKS